jgi:NAD(P)H-flavin reductase
LVQDAAQTPPGTVIIAVVKDDASAKLSQAAKDIFIGMGSKEISNLSKGDGWLFMGVYGSKQFVEKRGGQVSAGMILGYSRV